MSGFTVSSTSSKPKPAHLVQAADADLGFMATRAAATAFDVLTLLAVVIFISRFAEISLVSGILMFLCLKAIYEVGAVSIFGATAGKALLGLSISGHALFNEPPRVRNSAIRHLLKSGDLFFLAAISFIGAGVSIGSPGGITEYFYLVALLPLAIAANAGYLATPVSLWVSALNNDEHRGIHDRVACTYVYKR